MDGALGTSPAICWIGIRKPPAVKPKLQPTSSHGDISTDMWLHHGQLLVGPHRNMLVAADSNVAAESGRVVGSTARVDCSWDGGRRKQRLGAVTCIVVWR